jgi:RNA chaperone Hfq
MEILMFYTETFQTNYLDNLIGNKCFISVYLKSGIRLKGQLTGQTDKAVFLKHSANQIIFKNQISTISPEKMLIEF